MELSGSQERSRRELVTRKIGKEVLNLAGGLTTMYGAYVAIQSGALDSIPTPTPLSEHDAHGMLSTSIVAGGIAWYALRDGAQKLLSKMDGPPPEQK